ncbi:MAG: glutamate--tRNA ligase [Acidobacteria bacterium]|nr:glutamate--tRNA ligase [Acidobacteriota bacterium]MCI0567129.1 glutamate--tRNA ligase [Acidobacteriota bacterium]
MSVRVRFAPSPTGYLHVGGARTALFNWLFARRQEGTFILRIEDTDVERSREEMTEAILEGMRWLGLSWDEGPFYQSQRRDRHKETGRKLAASGHAYACFCPPAELKERREEAERKGVAWKYERVCLALPAEEVERRIASGAPHALRFRVPEGTTTWEDRVHGSTAFANETLEDFVLLRSDGTPTYHLSVVSDDVGMRISDVIRGDDHLSNTPKQILLYQALGMPTPTFAHLPLILGPDKKRLSKRHGAVAVTEYREAGYLPEALFNFLALLGWSPGDGREFLPREELVRLFSFDGVGKKGAVFDEQKLQWLNSQYIQAMPVAVIRESIRSELQAKGLWDPSLEGDRGAWFEQVVEILKARSRKLSDLARDCAIFLGERIEFSSEAVAKHLQDSATIQRMKELRTALAEVEPFDEASTEQSLRKVAERLGIAAAKLIHPLRVALTGQAISPGVFAVLVLVGRERALQRIDRLVQYLEARPPQPS